MDLMNNFAILKKYGRVKERLAFSIRVFIYEAAYDANFIDRANKPLKVYKIGFNELLFSKRSRGG